MALFLSLIFTIFDLGAEIGLLDLTRGLQPPRLGGQRQGVPQPICQGL